MTTHRRARGGAGGDAWQRRWRWRWQATLALALTAAACSTNLLHGLDERSANESIGALEHAGIATDKVAEEGGATTFTVRVARQEAARALDLLRSLGLPRDRRHGFAEVYGQPSLIPTASEERARYLDALGGEIERTLETADGVVSARVHLVLEESDPLAADPRPRTAARAAVLIKARGGRAPLPESDVQRLVAGSVPGLDPAAVAVVVTSAPDLADGAGPDAALTAVGPLRVASGSRTTVVGALVAGLVALAGLAALLLLTARKLATLQRDRQAR
ncbi:MAG TPA: secretion protein [Polyangia bacterium]|jgi:type III secretion protein J|nr:secretion protein [Polyangia bacterium]